MGWEDVVIVMVLIDGLMVVVGGGVGVGVGVRGGFQFDGG